MLHGAHALREHRAHAADSSYPVAGTAHQMMARARREREEDSWTSRSIGASNGWYVLHEGVCRSRGVGVRYVVIPCASERQNPGQAPRAWGRSLSKVYASTWSSLVVSITGGMTILLSPSMLSHRAWRLPLAERRAQALAASRRGSPQSAFSHLRESILFCITKEKQLFSLSAEKIVIAGMTRKKLQELERDLEAER